jgi:hypothetical protein
MRDRPNGAELLREARRVLREEIAAELEGELRFKALMVANAMAMAMRELERGDRPPRAELKALSELLAEIPDADDGLQRLETVLADLNSRFAAEIRGGRRDADAQAHELLLMQARARVEESNPKALQGDG